MDIREVSEQRIIIRDGLRNALRAFESENIEVCSKIIRGDVVPAIMTLLGEGNCGDCASKHEDATSEDRVASLFRRIEKIADEIEQLECDDDEDEDDDYMFVGESAVPPVHNAGFEHFNELIVNQDSVINISDLLDQGHMVNIQITPKDYYSEEE